MDMLVSNPHPIHFQPYCQLLQFCLYAAGNYILLFYNCYTPLSMTLLLLVVTKEKKKREKNHVLTPSLKKIIKKPQTSDATIFHFFF